MVWDILSLIHICSVLNAHYTSPVVIRAIYEAIEKMGFTKGNILEPSMGVGNFFGMLPQGMSESNLYGVELDSISGRIAKQLYPKADITVAGFETTDRRDFYDLAVGKMCIRDRYNDLLIRGFSVDVGVVYGMQKSKSGNQVKVAREIDFIASKGSKKVYIQSAYALPDSEKEEIENRPLKLVEDSFPKIIIRLSLIHI